jgi:predicted component of type VI protein secretion system
MATLTIQLPGMPPVSHVLQDETITVGRMKGNTIVIDDSSVSLTHARITRKNGEFYLKDLNSTNGTIVNGQRINEARLRDQDKVVFADNIFAQFQGDAQAAGVSAPAPAPVQPAKSVPPAAPAPAPAAAQKASASPSRTTTANTQNSSVSKFFTRLVSALGGTVALGVVGFLGWKMLHGGFDSSAGQTENPSVASAPMKQAAVANKTSPTEANTGKPEQVAPANSGSAASTPTTGGSESVAQLAIALRDPDPAERRRAATALHSLGAQAKEAAAALHAALDDSDQDVRMWAALTLVNNELHDKATIPILIGVLQRENPVLRQVACLSLGLIPYEDYEKNTVVPALTETATKDGDDEVRKAAVSALNIIAPDVAAKAVVK